MRNLLKAVLVGCGGISRVWIEGCRQIEDVELVGFVDLNPGAARQRAVEYGNANAVVGTELEAVLDQVAPDLVFDVTVPEAHMGVTLTALKHGCHVLGEKPLADSLENAQKMVAAAQASGKLYAVMQNRRHDPNIRRLKRFLASGVLGPLTTLNSDFYIGAHFGGFRDRMAHPLVLDMAIHTFDAARFIADADPVSVYCKEWNPVGSWYDGDASAIAIFEMSNGLVYTYRGSWCSEGLRTTWESEWRIIGQKGSAQWLGDEQMRAQVVTQTGDFFSTVTDVDLPANPDSDKVSGHASLIRDFVNCVRTGETPETICTDNIKSLAMVFGAIESAYQRKPIDIRW